MALTATASRRITIDRATNFDELMAGHTDKLSAALGYLATWGSSECFPEVVIRCIGDHGCWRGPEITAYYRNAEGKCGFTIGAVWDGSEFSFHS